MNLTFTTLTPDDYDGADDLARAREHLRLAEGLLATAEETLETEVASPELAVDLAKAHAVIAQAWASVAPSDSAA